MENRADRPQNFSLEVYITTRVQTGRVDIRMSADKWLSNIHGLDGGPVPPFQMAEALAPIYPDITYVDFQEVRKFNISRMLRQIGTGKDYKGIYVQARNDVIVYGFNKDTYTNDGFMGLPLDVLGTTYYAVVYWPPVPSSLYTEIGVVATADNTIVKFTFPGEQRGAHSYDPLRRVDIRYNGRMYSNGDTLVVTLDRLDTFQVQSVGDLTGTLIKSTKPVAAFSGNVRTWVGMEIWAEKEKSRDHLVEQLFPVEKWGKTFVTVPTPARTVGDFYM